MPITDEQAVKIKEQILKQVESFPEDKRNEIKSYVSSMSGEELEQFLVKNKMLAQKGSENQNSCIFCSIASKQIPAAAIYEDVDYLSVLEIKPFSPGHLLLIPKKHIKDTKDLNKKAFTIAKKIGKHLIKQLKAETFQTTASSEMGHAIINIIPVYKNQPLDFKRKTPKKEELEEIARKIGTIKKKEKIEKITTDNAPAVPKLKSEKIKEALIKLPRRIP